MYWSQEIHVFLPPESNDFPVKKAGESIRNFTEYKQQQIEPPACVLLRLINDGKKQSEEWVVDGQGRPASAAAHSKRRVADGNSDET